MQPARSAHDIVVDAHPEVDHGIPTTPEGARDFWAEYERRHPGVVMTAPAEQSAKL